MSRLNDYRGADFCRYGVAPGQSVAPPFAGAQQTACPCAGSAAEPAPEEGPAMRVTYPESAAPAMRVTYPENAAPVGGVFPPVTPFPPAP
ncbi:MAG: hypothetical protein IJK98_00995, partial [Clostridia bacterium]|nr:hypothetical protein [Clostridia bacterium]